MFGHFICRDCGSSLVYHSRRRNFLEKYVFPFLLVCPVRCANCFRRSRALIFVPALNRSQSSAEDPRARQEKEKSEYAGVSGR